MKRCLHLKFALLLILLFSVSANGGPATCTPNDAIHADGFESVINGARISVMDIVDHPPPIATLITVATPAADGTTSVSGAAGAVPPGVRVLVASLAYSDPGFVFANQDGSFDVNIPSAPGDTIQIRNLVELGNPFMPPDLAETVHWPGTLVRAKFAY